MPGAGVQFLHGERCSSHCHLQAGGAKGVSKSVFEVWFEWLPVVCQAMPALTMHVICYSGPACLHLQGTASNPGTIPVIRALRHESSSSYTVHLLTAIRWYSKYARCRPSTHACCLTMVLHAHACHQRTSMLAASTGFLANTVLHTPATARHPVPPHKFSHCLCLPIPACKSAMSAS